VAQLCEDLEEDVEKINSELDRMGYNIGIRLIEEFLARSMLPPCRTFQESADVLAKVGFKMFLGVQAQVAFSPEDEKRFSVILTPEENPLIEFVELPENLLKKRLSFSTVLAGVIRGCLEGILMRVETSVVKCPLLGDKFTEIVVSLKEIMREEYRNTDED
jgi:trafficking protein particle complex subunit 3